MGWFDEQIRDRKHNDDEAFAEAFAAAFVALAVCSAVLIAALEVACAVLTLFWVVLTVPFAVALTVFSAFRAVVLTVFLPCCRILIN